MARVIVLAASGFGKTVSFLPIPKIGVKGLPVASTFLISCTNRPLPYTKGIKDYPVTTAKNIRGGRRVISNEATVIESVLTQLLAAPPIKNVVLDDFNYIMQDWYMENALKTGWEAPKKIGADMGRLFKVFAKFEGIGKNVIILAHGEETTKSDGRIYTKMKTTGKMVDEYITPEGKFDVTLIGKSRFDPAANKVVKEYITNEDAIYASPKSPFGMLPDLYMPNDLGRIMERVDLFFSGQLADEDETTPEENGQTEGINFEENPKENLTENLESN